LFITMVVTTTIYILVSLSAVATVGWEALSVSSAPLAVSPAAFWVLPLMPL
jgi:amino acid transporter